MNDFVILTDSAADLSHEMVQKLGVEIVPLAFFMEEKTYYSYPDNRDIQPGVFYNKLRDGAVCTTSAANVGQFIEAAEPYLTQGKDVLILAFSSGLSVTYNSARLASEELSEKYPERNILVVDTLSGSMGQGLLVYYAAQQKKEGRSIEEVRDWVEQHKQKVRHCFTVSDLMFLKRGGRISSTTALVGTMLSIKPILHIDNEGHLINIGKKRGRKAALMELVDYMERSVADLENQIVFITHADCLTEAQFVADEVKKRFKVKDVCINYVGPVIGAHTGPDVVALFYLGKERGENE